MSLFIGKRVDNVPILRTTSGTSTLSDLKDVVPPANTIFDTSLPFLTCDVYTSISTTTVHTGYYDLVGAEFSSTDASAIAAAYGQSVTGGRPLIIYSINGEMVSGTGRIYNNSSFIFDWLDGYSFPDGSNVRAYRRVPTSTYRFKAFPSMLTTLGETAVKAYVFNISMYTALTGSTEKHISPFTQLSTGSVVLTDHQIQVNGINLADINFVTTTYIANAHSVVTGNLYGGGTGIGHVYVTNYLAGSDTELHATNTEVYIQNDNEEVLFHTSQGQIHIDFFMHYPSPETTSWIDNWTYNFTSTTDGNLADPWALKNYVAVLGSNILINGFFQQYNHSTGTIEPAAMSFFWTVSTSPTTLYILTITGSGTTYAWNLLHVVHNGVGRLAVQLQLLNMGSDGNPGVPPAPLINGLVQLK